MSCEAENTPDLIAQLKPSETLLFDLLRKRMSDSLLWGIAMSDYGSHGQENFEILQQIRTRGDIPFPLPWVPKEVLELTRWDEPVDPEGDTTGVAKPGHLMRAFSCVVLLRSEIVPTSNGWSGADNQTTVQLVASSLVLGDDVIQAAMCFMAWLFQSLPPDNVDAHSWRWRFSYSMHR